MGASENEYPREIDYNPCRLRASRHWLNHLAFGGPYSLVPVVFGKHCHSRGKYPAGHHNAYQSATELQGQTYTFDKVKRHRQLFIEVGSCGPSVFEFRRKRAQEDEGCMMAPLGMTVKIAQMWKSKGRPSCLVSENIVSSFGKLTKRMSSIII